LNELLREKKLSWRLLSTVMVLIKKPWRDNSDFKAYVP
jgi:hypothetical protein